jgi:hypothetical protein
METNTEQDCDLFLSLSLSLSELVHGLLGCGVGTKEYEAGIVVMNYLVRTANERTANIDRE